MSCAIQRRWDLFFVREKKLGARLREEGAFGIFALPTGHHHLDHLDAPYLHCGLFTVMWTSTRVAVRLGTSTFRFQLPALGSWTGSSSLTPALAGLSTPTAGSAPSESGLAGLWNGILLAVPKKKVSHSRKSMRAANKGLKDRVDLVHCSACGKPKLQQHICAYCYNELNRARKSALAQSTDATAKTQPEPTQQ